MHWRFCVGSVSITIDVDFIPIDVRFDGGNTGLRRDAVTIPIWGQKKCQVDDVGAQSARR
jgi:hypothetical protein